MQPDEVTSIESQESAPLRGGIGQHLIIWNPLIGLPSLQRRQHIVTERTQRFNHLEGKILVGIKSSQGSGGLVLSDSAVDLGPVGIGIGPGLD